MRRALLALGLLGALLVTAGSGGSAGEAASVSQANVCSAASFSVLKAHCIVDERAGVLASTIHCSAQVRGLSGTRYRGTFSFRGRSFPARTGVVRGDGWIYTSLSIKGGTFPAGPWSCAIDAGGSRASVSFVTTGASGRVTSVAACPTSVTVVSSSGVRACRDDRGARPFGPTSAITCSGVFALADGRTASAELRYRGRPTGLSLARALPLPVSIFGMQVARRGGLPAGPYSCVFSVDGKRVATHPFSIAAGQRSPVSG